MLCTAFFIADANLQKLKMMLFCFSTPVEHPGAPEAIECPLPRSGTAATGSFQQNIK